MHFVNLFSLVVLTQIICIMSVNDSDWSFPVVLSSCFLFFCTFIHFEKSECVINREITVWKMAVQEKNIVVEELYSTLSHAS